MLIILSNSLCFLLFSTHYFRNVKWLFEHNQNFFVQFYFGYFKRFVPFCFISGANSNNGIVVTIENVSNNRLKPQEITVVEDGDCNQQQNRHFASNRTSSPYSSTSYGGSGGTGGGGPSWHGKCPHCYQEYANISSLKYHVRLVHSEANNTICCYLCPQNFSSKLIMREHLFTCHNVKYQ